LESKTKSAKGLILENKRKSQYYCKRSNVLDNKRKSKKIVQKKWSVVKTSQICMFSSC